MFEDNAVSYILYLYKLLSYIYIYNALRTCDDLFSSQNMSINHQPGGPIMVPFAKIKN